MALGPLAPWLDRGFRDDAGNVLSGGLVYSYLAGTSTPTDTYTASDLVTPNANPVVLDSAGRATIYLDPDITYKFIVQDSEGTTLYTLDDVPGSIPFQTPITITEDGIGSTSTDGIVLINNTVAANGAQQWSPRIRWTGAGWNATASASRVIDTLAELIPIQAGSGDPVAAFTISTQVNAGGYTPRLAMRSDGLATLAPTGQLAWSSSGVTSADTAISRVAAQKLRLDDTADASGIVLDFSTDGQLSLRNVADSGFASLKVDFAIYGGSTATSGVLRLASNTTGIVARDAADTGNVGVITTDGSDNVVVGFSNAQSIVLKPQNVEKFSFAPSGDMTLADTGGDIIWSAQSRIANQANGLINFLQNSGSVGIGMRFSTDGLLEIRDRTNANDADLRAGNITASLDVEATTGFLINGSPGIDFGPAAPASITVSKGIIVAAS